MLSRIAVIAVRRVAAAALLGTLWWAMATTYLAAPHPIGDDPLLAVALLIVGVTVVGGALLGKFEGRHPASDKTAHRG